MSTVDEVITAAGELPAKFDELKGRLGKPALMRWDDYPDATLHKLEVMARSAYLAGLHLLRNPDVAYRAEDLIRGILECLAHVTYIAGLRPMTYRRNPEQRALCVELGMIKGLHNLLKKLPDDALMQDSSVRGAVAADEDEIRRVHSATGCKCGGRSDGLVEPTLREAAAKVGPPWTTLSGVYASASTLMHQVLYQRLLKEVASGITDWVPADNEHRIKLLTWLVSSYELMVSQILYLHDPTLSDEFHDAALNVLELAKAV